MRGQHAGHHKLMRGDLTAVIKFATLLQEPAARWFFQQLVIGLDYCHRKGVVNRDIKLENTLLQMVPVSSAWLTSCHVDALMLVSEHKLWLHASLIIVQHNRGLLPWHEPAA